MAPKNKFERLIYVVGKANHYANWMEGKITSHMPDADLVLFTGGEDVTPGLYKEDKHPLTSCNLKRDQFEIDEYNKALKMGKRMLGICRGSQLLTVMNGGRLVQHQNNPGTHLMKTFDEEHVVITSTHHQASYPFDLPEENFQIIFWTEDMLRYHLNGKGEEMAPEVEVEGVHYPKSKCLCIQGHPEQFGERHPTIHYMQYILNIFMRGVLKEYVDRTIEKLEKEKEKQLQEQV